MPNRPREPARDVCSRRRHLEGRAVWIGGIGCRQHDDLRFVIGHAQRTQQLEGAGHRELCRAETGDEIAAANPAMFFHRLQHGVDRAEAPRQVVASRRLACQDAVPVQQLLGDGCGPSGRVALGPRCTRLHRPSAVGGTNRRERKTGAAAGRLMRRRGVRADVNARSAWNVSLVIAPRHTRSHSTSTVSPG